MWRAAGNATAVPAAKVINASGTPAMIIQKMRRRMLHMLRQFSGILAVSLAGHRLSRHAIRYK
jgi:hypothetical protein